MIKIDLVRHRKVIEQYEELEYYLQNEREKQLELADYLKNKISGQTAITVRTMYPMMLQSGIYEKTVKQVTGMKTIMEEVEPSLKRLKSSCDNFDRRLSAGGAISVAEDGQILMLEESRIPVIDNLCEEVISYNDKVNGILEEVMNLCGSLVDFGTERTALEEAYRQTAQIGILKEAIDDYARELRDIDSHLSIAYAAWMDDGILAEIEQQRQKLSMQLIEKDMTLEQYRAALLDTFMYLDIFTDDKEYDYYYQYIERKLYDGMTINDMLEILSVFPIYTDKNMAGDTTRYIYYRILTDAVEKDPDFGNFQISYMSRTMYNTDGSFRFNEGTNGMVFLDLASDTIYVAYRGTSEGEWGDDGARFDCRDTNDITEQMRQTLEYFNYVGEAMEWTRDKNIIVTGHSQGGNDAQISMLLSDYGHIVDYCFSFDGEGHSPDLIESLKLELAKKYGANEYEDRLNRMYSICGEYDFVNHLGDKVISEKNTKYVKCNMKMTDIARYHDIVSMFCDENMKYNGMINTSVGTSPTCVTELTAQMWNQLKVLPDNKRESCEAALMNLAEMGLSGFETFEGLNGEKASIDDWITFVIYGMPLITGNLGEEADLMQLRLPGAFSSAVINYAEEKGLVATETAKEVKNVINNITAQYTDGYKILADVKEGIQTEMIFAFTGELSSTNHSEWVNAYTYEIGEKVVDYVLSTADSVQSLLNVGNKGIGFIQDTIVEVGKDIINRLGD